MSWPPVIEYYRDLLVAFSKDVPTWAATTRAARKWMASRDPDYPLYHLTAPEGWNNDPNGVTFDPAGAPGGLYHRFYQYDKTYSDDCMHSRTTNCTFHGKVIANPAARVWGHTVSRDGATWEDWPGIDADAPWDQLGVFSGNCVLKDGNPVCIYSGGQVTHCDTAVCATSEDWVHWKKAACMSQSPSPASQTNHDSSIWRDGPHGSWYMLSGGCTYDGGNTPSPGVPCKGNAQLWRSEDLVNFTYITAIAPGGPGRYWELPYLLPFSKEGEAIDNYHHAGAHTYALLFGDGNAYYVGDYDSTTMRFMPLGVVNETQQRRELLLSSASAIGSWPLAKASGAATIGPAAVLHGVRAIADGTAFEMASTMAIPFFAALNERPAHVGFSASFRIQLNADARENNAAAALEKQGTILARGEGGLWGFEYWGGSLINFYIRGPHGSLFRGIQAKLILPNRTRTGWVRIAVRYDEGAPFASNIRMFAAGAALTPLSSAAGGEPGSLTGAFGNSTNGIVSVKLPNIDLADVVLYSAALSDEDLAKVTSAPVPAPVPPIPTPPPTPSSDSPPAGWPPRNLSDSASSYYSFNPHATDTRGPGNATRRLMFGWVTGAVSDAVTAKRVPYWQSAHSLMRTVTVSRAKSSIVQLPAPGTFEPLRGARSVFGPLAIGDGAQYLPSLTGDALELIATFSTAGSATSFGISLRVGSGDDFKGCDVGYAPATQSIIAPGAGAGWFAGITPQPGAPQTATLHVFLDRSIIEVYSGGAAFTARCALPKWDLNATGLDLWSKGGNTTLVKLEAFAMRTMWGKISNEQ